MMEKWKGRATASRLAAGAWLRDLNTEDTEIDTEAMTRGCSRRGAKAQRVFGEVFDTLRSNAPAPLRLCEKKNRAMYSNSP